MTSRCFTELNHSVSVTTLGWIISFDQSLDLFSDSWLHTERSPLFVCALAFGLEREHISQPEVEVLTLCELLKDKLDSQKIASEYSSV